MSSDESKPKKPKEPSITDFTVIKVSIKPYYESEGVKIEVGRYSKDFAITDEKKFLEAIFKIKENWENLTAEELFIGAIRLYDMEFRDEAVYWFYSAQFRAKVYQGSLAQPKAEKMGDPIFDLQKIQKDFFKGTGQYINGYAFRSLDKVGKVIERVIKDSEKLPDMSKIYPQTTFVEPAKQKEIIQATIDDLAKVSGMLIEKKDEIKKMRVDSGLDMKFTLIKNREFLKPKE
jgi:hypothetical protein